jgi:hypothetical protein
VEVGRLREWLHTRRELAPPTAAEKRVPVAAR